MPSFVWEFFAKISPDTAQCNEKGCGKSFKWSKGVSAMVTHLKSSHNIVDRKDTKRAASLELTESPSASKRQKNLFECFKKSSIEEEVARLVAESNFSFSQVSGTSFLRESLSKKYPNSTVPKCHKSVAALMMKYFEYAENEVKQRIQKLKFDGKKFSATLDEWTSSANCRFLNINLHFTIAADGETSHINLGLIKIRGKCPANAMVNLVSIKFLVFDY